MKEGNEGAVKNLSTAELIIIWIILDGESDYHPRTLRLTQGIPAGLEGRNHQCYRISPDREGCR
jgi:hypothetical protein